MARTIFTQQKNLVVYDNLLAVYVEEDRDEETGALLGFDIVGIQDLKSGSIVLGSFNSEQSAQLAMASLIHWVQYTDFSTFQIPNDEGEGGEV